jgi:Zn finger protein HypA/HybF involved in hydrogenase expression
MSNTLETGLLKDEINSVEDVPETARLADRQQLVVRRGRWIAIAPLAVLFALDKSWKDSQAKDFAMYSALAWCLIICCYSLYLMLAVRCPRCGNRFGISEACRSCSLPRHRKISNEVSA